MFWKENWVGGRHKHFHVTGHYHSEKWGDRVAAWGAPRQQEHEQYLAVVENLEDRL